MQPVLNAQIDLGRDRILLPVRRYASHVQGSKSWAVEPLFDAGDALIIDIDVADEMRNLGSIGVIAFVFVEKADAWQALPVDFALLLRRDVTFEPNETPLR